jgi:hypothetical protein
MRRRALLAVVLASLVVGVLAVPDPTEVSHEGGKPPVAARAAKPSISFVPNRGQTHKDVRYVAQADGYGLFLTPKAAVMSLPAAKGQRDSLRVGFVGAETDPAIVGERKLEGVANYYVGADATKWVTGLPTYAAARYRSLYPGIDVVFRGAGDALEYDFHVAPGADPSVIRMRFKGSRSLKIDRRGNLLIHTANGTVTMHAPHSFQHLGDGRRTVESSWKLVGRDETAFALGAYSRTYPLVIDPKVVYSTYLGGTGSDEANAVGSYQESAYATGTTYSIDFPVTPGASQPDFSGGLDGDAFVTRLNKTGTQAIYSTYLGGGALDISSALDVESGAAYITGWTQSTDFPTLNARQADPNDANADAFIAKFTPTGELAYSTYFGGKNYDSGLAIDAVKGEAYVTGETASTDLPGTSGVRPPSTGYDAFVTGLSADASDVLYTAFVSGSGAESGKGIKVKSGVAYIGGTTSSPNLPTTSGSYQAVQSGGQDGFVAKVDAAGELLAVTYLGGTSADRLEDLEFINGTVYVTGGTDSSDFPTTSRYQNTYAGGADVFVSRLSATLSTLMASTYLGGSTFDEGTALAVVPASGKENEVFVTGHAGSSDFPYTRNAYQPCNSPTSAFLAQIILRSSPLPPGAIPGSVPQLKYSTCVDADDPTRGHDLAREPGVVFISGNAGPDLRTTHRAFQTRYGGGFVDGFVVRFDFPAS